MLGIDRGQLIAALLVAIGVAGEFVTPETSRQGPSHIESRQPINAAKWQVFSPAGVLDMAGTGVPFGARPMLEQGVVIKNSGDAGSRDAASAVAAELVALGCHAVVSPTTEPRDIPTVFVEVKVRLEGPQGQAKIATHK